MSKTKRLSSGSNRSGFTLVELLVALIVSSVVLTAVATLAYALSSANDSTNDTSRKQAQVRYTTLRISDLIRHCKLICFAGPDDFVVWRADDNPEDGQINASELVIIERGSSREYLQLCDFPDGGADPVALSDIHAYSTSWWLSLGLSIRPTPLIKQCSNVQFSFDVLPPPLHTRFVNISFDLLENNISRQYQINAFVRGWAGNLLNEAGDGLVVSDDD